MALPRFHHAVIAAILIHGLHAAAMPTMVLAADQEMPRRHSLIHHSAVETAVPSATTHGTTLPSSNDKPTHITRPIEPPIAAIVPPAIALPHFQIGTKRPAIASIIAPVPSSHIPHAAPPSDIAAGQGTPTTATLITTPIAAPLAGMTSTGSIVAATTTPSRLAGTADVHSTASAGGGNASFSSSRSTVNLFKNSAIASLLQPQTPVITIPPSPPPRSTPPSTPPPANESTGKVTLAWKANREPDLAGYKIYIGTTSGTYNFAGSPFSINNTTSYIASNLPKGQTYFFAISAYDSAGNESVLSAEVSKSLY